MYFRHLFFTAVFLACAVLGPIIILRGSNGHSENYIYEMAKSFIKEELVIEKGDEIVYPEYSENYVTCVDKDQELKKITELSLNQLVKSSRDDLKENFNLDEFSGTIYRINSYFDLLESSGRKQKHNYVCILTVNAGNIWTLLDLSHSRSSKSMVSN